MKNTPKNLTLRLCITAMFMAVNIVLSSSVFSVPVPGGHLYMNDIAICTASLVLDPISAFIVGGIGSFIGDLLFYPAPMFVSLVTHGVQAAVISIIAHHTLKSHKLVASSLGVFAGAVIMVAGYSFGRAYIYSTPEYALLKLPYQILQAAVGAVAGVLICHRFGVIKLAKKAGFYYGA